MKERRLSNGMINWVLYVETEMVDNPGEAVVQESEAALDAYLRTARIIRLLWRQRPHRKMETWGRGMKKRVVVYGVFRF
jgi:hypothetical protein